MTFLQSPISSLTIRDGDRGETFLTVVKIIHVWTYEVTNKGQKLFLRLMLSQVIETKAQLGDEFNIFGVVAVTNTVSRWS